MRCRKVWILMITGLNGVGKFQIPGKPLLEQPFQNYYCEVDLRAGILE